MVVLLSSTNGSSRVQSKQDRFDIAEVADSARSQAVDNVLVRQMLDAMADRLGEFTEPKLRL